MVEQTGKAAENSATAEAAGARMSDYIYGQLMRRIVDGALQPGDVINELALSRELGVSRTPVHEAVCALESDGLVVQEGTRRRAVATFNASDVYDIFEMRLLLESEAARRAASNIDRPTLARLRAQAEALQAPQPEEAWLAAWADFDDVFHAEIAMACGSRRLLQDINRYRNLHRALNALHTDATALRQALAEHLDILAALEDRDPERAAREMARHLREWQAFFTRAVAR